ncbi:MAG: LTA synthase family protein [Tissierellia bacterium]|nr:LTA synthase family protein [Tissierellia bacterium]
MKDSKLHLILGIFFGLIFAGIICFAIYFLQMTPISEMIPLWEDNPWSLVLNILPIFFCILFLFFLTNQLGFSIGLSGGYFTLLGYIHSQKVLFRQEPLVPSDTIMIKEGINMMRTEGFGLSPKVFLGIFLWVLCFISFIFLFRKIKVSFKTRLFGLGIVLLSSVVLLFTLYSSDDIYHSFPSLTEEETNISQSFRDKGFLYCYLYHRHTNKVEKPKCYISGLGERIEEMYPIKKVSGKKPHVVMIMGEAWADIHRSDRIHFHDGMDPFKFADPIMKNSLASGKIIVPVYGGGTANTEYDSLTGNSTLFHSTNIFNSYKSIRKDKKSIVDVFKKNGYDTVGIHPGKSWFYGREDVYPRLGFASSYFEDDFKGGEYKGGYMSEKSMTKFLIDRFETRDPQKPLFEFGVTIQNHSPFGKDKYGYIPHTFEGDFSSDVKENLEGFFIGIRDMDEQIKELTDYFDSIDEPILFVYYGDHLPYLVPDFQDLKELGVKVQPGVAEGIYEVYQTPYFIWGNQRYHQDFPTWEESLATTERISASFLGPLLLKAAGLEGTDPYYQYYNDLRQRLPVIFPFFAGVVENGEYRFRKWDEVSEDIITQRDEYLSINYDTFFMKE